jgi:hypothetical protein
MLTPVLASLLEKLTTNEGWLAETLASSDDGEARQLFPLFTTPEGAAELRDELNALSKALDGFAKSAFPSSLFQPNKPPVGLHIWVHRLKCPHCGVLPLHCQGCGHKV